MQRLPFTREERFISIDKPALKPLRAESFEIKYRCELLVNPNSFIYMGRTKNYYSVPYRLIGQKVKVIYTRTLVNIYSWQGERVATHLRSYKVGEYVRNDAHLTITTILLAHRTGAIVGLSSGPHFCSSSIHFETHLTSHNP